MKLIKLYISRDKACLVAFVLIIAGALVWFTFRSYRDPVVTEVTIESSKVTEPITVLQWMKLLFRR